VSAAKSGAVSLMRSIWGAAVATSVLIGFFS
jgi:hypothetical protein